MQVRCIIRFELIVERLRLFFLSRWNIAEYIDHVDAVRNIVHRNPVIVWKVGVDTLHRDITPRAVVHHEMATGRLYGFLCRRNGVRIRYRCKRTCCGHRCRYDACGHRRHITRHHLFDESHSSAFLTVMVLIFLINRGKGDAPMANRTIFGTIAGRN